MAVKSSKHKDVQHIQMVFSGGLNYAQIPTALKDDEVRVALNFIYDPATEYLITRPGTTCVTAAKCDGTHPIIALYYFEHSSTEAWLVAACNGNLYYLSGTAWVLIGALNDTTTVPSFLTFNTKLLIADGGTNIKLWDGTTYGVCADSPNASALAMIKNRVVANHVSEPDSVYLSSTNDCESTHAWHTDGLDGSTGVGLKVGYGDLLAVTAFGVFGDDLIVFKKGDVTKKVCRVNVADSTTANWYGNDLSVNNGAQNAQSVTDAWNNIYFVDSNGFKSLRGVDAYGDLQVDPLGWKINNIFTSQTSCDFLSYVPKYNAVWFGMGDRVFCFTERLTVGGDVISAFTDILFKQGRIRAICQVGEIAYLAGHDGFLYKLDESVATDATDASTNVNFASTLRTKTLSFIGGGILRKTKLSIRPKEAGSASLMAYTTEETGTELKAITLTSDGDDLYDATGDLADATGYLYEGGGYGVTETSRNRVRSDELAFEIVISTGRAGIERIVAEIAMVEG